MSKYKYKYIPIKNSHFNIIRNESGECIAEVLKKSDADLIVEALNDHDELIFARIKKEGK